MSLIEDLLTGGDRKVKPVKFAGRAAHVRSLSAAEMLDYFAAAEAIGEGNTAAKAALHVSVFLSDEHGNALATFEEAKVLVSRYSPGVIRDVTNAGQKLCGLTQDDADAVAGDSEPGRE